MEGDSPFVSTGELPPADLASRLVAEAHERYRSTADGAVSEVYPALARVPPDLFGICVVATHGEVFSVGDAEVEFAIMSVAKPFVFALVCRDPGARGGAAPARRQQHRPGVQLAVGDRGRAPTVARTRW